MNAKKLEETLTAHKTWLSNKPGGQRADLHEADLRGADLHGADLRGADLDFSSGIPFHCGGANFVGDDRLFAQMLFHLTRANWSQCSGGVKETLDHIMQCAAVDLFCEYRNDICPLNKACHKES